MASDRQRAHELRHAYHAGWAGAGKEVLPAGSDRHVHDAYEQGERDREAEDRGTTTRKAKEDRTQAGGQRPVRQAPPVSRARAGAAAAGKAAGKAAGGYAARGFSPRGAGRKLAATRPGRAITRTVGAGDTGGLLLAVVVYPVFLAAMKYGPSGPGDWFRAKWLNRTPGQDGATKRVQGNPSPPGVPNLLNPHPHHHAHRHPGHPTPRGRH